MKRMNVAAAAAVASIALAACTGSGGAAQSGPATVSDEQSSGTVVADIMYQEGKEYANGEPVMTENVQLFAYGDFPVADGVNGFIVQYVNVDPAAAPVKVESVKVNGESADFEEIDLGYEVPEGEDVVLPVTIHVKGVSAGDKVTVHVDGKDVIFVNKESEMAGTPVAEDSSDAPASSN